MAVMVPFRMLDGEQTMRKRMKKKCTQIATINCQLKT